MRSETRNMIAHALVLCACAFVLGAIVGGQSGFNAAKRQAEAERLWVNEQMEKAGFCAWVKVSKFAAHCNNQEAITDAQ